jgi:hypothetical protein
MNSVTPKAGAEHELLFNKPAYEGSILRLIYIGEVYAAMSIGFPLSVVLMNVVIPIT